MGRLVIVSNRLPVTIDKKGGELFFHPSAGGLATGLNSLSDSYDKIWIGWPGTIVQEDEKSGVTESLAQDGLVPVFLSEDEIDAYYEGFSNKTIWPHFHYFTQYTNYNDHFWEVYKTVNAKFSAVISEHLQPDDLVWIHDYQLMLLPGMVRKAHPTQSIGFFLHIPFPSFEIFRILPWRGKILKGLLGADQIGFHTYGYMRHFLSAVYRISGVEHNFGKLAVDNRVVNVDVFPMGIEYDKYAFPERLLKGENIASKVSNFLSKNRKLIISIDRLDYTKGIPNRLRAFQQFLKLHPEFHDKVTLMMIVVPSRSNVDQYQELKNQIETLVGQIDGEYRSFRWSPIQYYYRSFNFADLCALYKAADIAMITPLRDGMNLVAKEYIASKEENKKGVLILSEMAGAANELTDAILINPQDTNEMVKAIEEAIIMPLEEQKIRLEKMQQRLKKYSVQHWAESFITEQTKMIASNEERKTRELKKKNYDDLVQKYSKAKTRLLLLDYDGTLTGFHGNPDDAKPDAELLKILAALKKQEGTQTIIISGRDKNTLDKWMKGFDFEMAAEHGVWYNRGKGWKVNKGLSKDWKEKVRAVLENMVERTPGSFIEEKDYSLVWHYRMIDKALGEKRIREFRDVLQYLTANLDLQVLEGNKVVEIKNAGVNKGKAALNWINKKPWDFILAVGDDSTDEDTFKVIPPDQYSIKVGLAQTAARYNLIGVEQVRGLLKKLIDTSEA